MEQLVTFKINKDLLARIDKFTHKLGFSTRTDFIKYAIHTAMENYEGDSILVDAKFLKYLMKETSEKISQDVTGEFRRKMSTLIEKMVLESTMQILDQRGVKFDD